MYHNQQLPVSTTQVDGSTFNHSLPQGNDVWPPIQLPQGIDVQIVNAVVSNFRMFAQSRHNKSPLHCFVYNLLSSNRFNNQLIIEWCQRAVDFCEFLMVVQRNTPQDAITKAAGKIYMSLLAVTASQYPQVAQQLPQDMINQLTQVGAEFNDIQRDIHGFKSTRAMPQGNMGYAQGQVQGNGMLPPINPNQQYHNQPMQGGVQQILNTYAPTASAHVQNQQHPTGQTQTGRSSGMLLDVASTPIQSQSWDASAATQSHPQSTAQVHQPINETNLPVPQNVDELVIDPRYYTPKGFVIDTSRPFDWIHNPGGIEIRPAHHASWTRTEGDDQPYRTAYDAEQFIRFMAKWPDGNVKEVFVAVKPEMEYLLHEIRDELRMKAIQPKGVVVANMTGIIDADKDAKPIAVVRNEKDEHLDDEFEMSPVVLDTCLYSGSELDDEKEAKLIVRKMLDIADTDPVPAHEYRSYRLHPLDVDELCQEALMNLKEYKSFEAAAVKLQSLLDENYLPIRYFRFLDKRLTGAVNQYLKDSMGVKAIAIESFVTDIKDLGPYLANKKGTSYQKILDGSVATILNKALTFGTNDEEDDQGESVSVFGVLDQFINFQVGWTEQDLENLEISDEAILLSGYTHPKVLNVVKGMISRANADGYLQSSKLRIISADGIYYEIIRGKLIENAVLLKKL